MDSLENLLTGLEKRQVRALARAISHIEDDGPFREAMIAYCFARGGRAHVLGVTGAPGAGKSSLVDRMVAFLRRQGKTVGVVAVDPSSPFSGGALLGDRIRMQDHATDKGVFIRSMSTRGSLGGLAYTTKDVVKIMDAYGFDIIIVETVGVGQAELDIMHVADTTLVVLTPGAGDAIQTIKAGIMEIADIFVVNKADLPGAEKVVGEIEMMLDMKCDHCVFRPPVVSVSALEGRGVEQLWQAVEKHVAYMQESGVLTTRREQRCVNETLSLVDYFWHRFVEKQYRRRDSVIRLLDQVKARKSDPYSAARQILTMICNGIAVASQEQG
ncbi:MAG: methylmalonyl Co-A mutase-associated GTPase MeaB [Bacillota bacterium]